MHLACSVVIGRLREALPRPSGLRLNIYNPASGGPAVEAVSAPLQLRSLMWARACSGDRPGARWYVGSTACGLIG
jgi:hypothetical protein